MLLLSQVKMLVLLGEVGGVEEYEVCQALQNKRITKPIVAWCIGTCAGGYAIAWSRRFVSNISSFFFFSFFLFIFPSYF